jgi:predicted Rossmann fold nucleotide-binding protein DprA/Smf involved in DNA uptake
MKKAQGISINVIVIAAIALAVLVVLFAIFTGRLNIFSVGLQQTDTCAQKCESLNMETGTNLITEGALCANDEQKIAGKYSDSQFGCCCRQKLV